MWQWKDDPHRIEPKLSYIKYFEPWGWVVGTGIYLNDVNQKIADLSRTLFIISVSIITLISLLTFYMTMRALQATRLQMQTEAELRKHEDYLEKLVEERTVDLTRSNQQLQEEIAVRKTLEEKLFHASITDTLTGLYNRRGFFEFAKKHLQIANRKKISLYLLYMDLDNMKEINDRFGHETGDRALIETADILNEFFRQSDIISRLGGDEFAILMCNHFDSSDEHTLVSRFQQQLTSANATAHRPYQLSISVGAVGYDPEFPCSVEELLSKGDALMYAHKKKSQQA
jgi:diguanylate cyclase (GGDEF)-like protein